MQNYCRFLNSVNLFYSMRPSLDWVRSPFCYQISVWSCDSPISLNSLTVCTTISSGLYPQDYIHRTISTGLYPQDYIQRTISSGLYPQDYILRTVSSGLRDTSLFLVSATGISRFLMMIIMDCTWFLKLVWLCVHKMILFSNCFLETVEIFFLDLNQTSSSNLYKR